MSNSVSEDDFLSAEAASVYNLALRLVGNQTDAEDLAQEALLRAIKALPEFRNESSLRTWAYRITVNAWKNRVRSEKRRRFWALAPLGRRPPREDSDLTAEEPPAREPPLDSRLETLEREAVVQKALLELSETDRAVIVLREIENLSYRDIAAALDIPEGTVKSRIFRARHSLKSLLLGYASL